MVKKGNVLDTLISLRDEKIGDQQILEALNVAISAVMRAPDYKKLGARGGRSTFKKYGVAEMRRRGKLGGRPKKSEP